MSKDINLAPHKRKEVLEKQKRVRVFRSASVSFFAVVVVITVGVILLNIFSPVGGLKAEKNSLLTQLSARSDEIEKYSFITSRIRDVSDIIAKRSSYHTIVQELLNSLPGNVEVESLKISERKVSVIVSSNSLSSLNTFIDSLIALTSTSSIFERVLLDNLNSDGLRGKYDASITLDTT